MRRALRAVLGAAVGITFLALALRGVDAAALGAALAAASPGWIVAGVAALAAGYALRITRWRELLSVSRPGITTRACAGPLVAGFALNNVLPLRAGDLARAFAFRERLGVPAPEILGSLVAERVLDLTTLVAWFAAGALAAGRSHVPPAASRAAVIGAAACLIVLAAIALVPASAWTRLRAGRGLVGAAGRVVGALDVLRDPKRLARLTAWSAAAWGCEALVFAAAAHSLGVSIPLAAAPFVLGAATLATMIPGTPGHLGTFDFFARSAATGLGVPEGPALAYALTVHLVIWAPITIAGLLWLLAHGAGVREAVRRGRGEEAA